MNAEQFSDVNSWRKTTYALVAISLLIFLVQRTSWAIFDTIFEVCIFHIPALASSILYARMLASTDGGLQNGK